MTIPINSMVLGKLGTNGDRQTFGIGADGDPSPSLSTAHHHAVCYGINPQGGGAVMQSAFCKNNQRRHVRFPTAQHRQHYRRTQITSRSATTATTKEDMMRYQ